MSQTRNGTAAILVAVTLLLLSTLYVGGYFALSDPMEIAIGSHDEEWITWGHVQRFRIGASWIDAAYWPMTQLDYLLRREFWQAAEYHPPPVELSPPGARR